MARKEITNRSSTSERNIAARQLQQAQSEYRSIIDNAPKDSEGYPLNPDNPTERLSSADLSRIANRISSKYDYVSYGNDSGLTDFQYSVTGDVFFVKGLGTRDSLSSSFDGLMQTIGQSTDDGYPVLSSQAPSNTVLTSGSRYSVAIGNQPSTAFGDTISDSPSLRGATETQTDVGAAGLNTPVQNQQSSEYGIIESNPNSNRVSRTAGSGNGLSGDDSSIGSGTGIGSTDRTTIFSAGAPIGGGNTTGSVSIGVQGQSPQLGGTGITTPNNSKIKLRPNKLHEYVNWTYNISMYMLSAETFNKFCKSGKDSDAANLRKYPIFRSGGSKKSSGNPIDFDLSLRSLRFTTVVGQRLTPGTNSFNFEMKLNEPYGVSFIPKLTDLSISVLGDTDIPLSQIPFLLEIKWMGYDDAGNLVTNIADTGPKLYTVSILNISMNISPTGTEYTVIMSPYSQIPLDEQYGRIRDTKSIYGFTFNEMMNGSHGLSTSLNLSSKKDVADGNAEYADIYEIKITSFDKSRSADDGKLAKSAMTVPIVGGSNQILPGDRNLKEYPCHTITGGSNIKDVIVELAKKTTYFQNLVPEKPNGDKNNPLVLIKVVPVITELKNFDRKRNQYQKHIVYKVFPAFYYGQSHPFGGQAKVSDRGMVKEYNWLFTGKNQDILDLNIEYNLIGYFVFDKNQRSRALMESNADVEKTAEGIALPNRNEGAIAAIPVGGDVSPVSNKGPKVNAVYEAFDYMLSNRMNPDLAQLEMQIIGDPDWLSQDRSLRPVDTDTNANNTGYVDNDYSKGIAIDVDIPYVKMSFKTPRDYSDASGLMELSADQTMVSGVYMVITCDSVFEDGRFTQNLSMVRVPVQEENKVLSSTASNSGSTASQVTVSNRASENE